MPRIDPVELVSGLAVIAVGAFFYFGALDYRMGTMVRMGPGFVPHWLGAISMGLGVLVVLTGLRRSGSFPHVAWRATAAIAGSILAFALLLPRLGMVPAVFVAAAVSMLGNPDARLPQILVVSTAIAALCWTVFLLLLGLPITAFELDL